MVLEIDGYSHNFEEVVVNDRRKEESFQKLGLSVIRFDDREVMNDLPSVLKVIENFILDFEEQKR